MDMKKLLTAGRGITWDKPFSMPIEREKIITAISDGLKDNPDVFALWLEGADSNENIDEYSDIDLVADVKDGGEESVLKNIGEILRNLDELDLEYEYPKPHPKLRYKIFHLKNTTEYLLIDVTIQSHSRNFEFVEGNKYESLKILFDKAGVIKFRKIDDEKLRKEICESLTVLENIFFQRSKVKKYILRNKYLEAFAYYNKNALEPLVELLRICHTPIIRDYHLIHISDHLPKEIVLKVENLYHINTVDDIAKNLKEAEKLFANAMKEAKQKYCS